MCVSEKNREYPGDLETYKTTKKGLKVFIRPATISDESHLRDFFDLLSVKSIYQRFFTPRVNLSHRFLQNFVAIDYSTKMVLLVVLKQGKKEEVIGVGQYVVMDKTNMGDLALAVRDDYQNQGIGTELLSYLIHLGKKKGLSGFTADVLGENRAMLTLLSKLNYPLEKRIVGGVFEIKFFLDPDENHARENHAHEKMNEFIP